MRYDIDALHDRIAEKANTAREKREEERRAFFAEQEERKARRAKEMQAIIDKTGEAMRAKAEAEAIAEADRLAEIEAQRIRDEVRKAKGLRTEKEEENLNSLREMLGQMKDNGVFEPKGTIL